MNLVCLKNKKLVRKKKTDRETTVQRGMDSMGFWRKKKKTARHAFNNIATIHDRIHCTTDLAILIEAMMRRESVGAIDSPHTPVVCLLYQMFHLFSLDSFAITVELFVLFYSTTHFLLRNMQFLIRKNIKQIMMLTSCIINKFLFYISFKTLYKHFCILFHLYNANCTNSHFRRDIANHGCLSASVSLVCFC